MSLLLALLAPPAQAATQLQVEASAAQLDADGRGVGFALGAELSAGGPAALSADVRLSAPGAWLGRGTVSYDLFGRSETLDLRAGLFLGTTGFTWPVRASAVDPTAGFELVFGLNPGPIRARYRHLDGFRGPLEARLTEDEWRLGFELGRLQVFGQHTRFNPGEEPRERGFGLGAGLSF